MHNKTACNSYLIPGRLPPLPQRTRATSVFPTAR